MIFSVILIVAGLFSLGGAYYNWGWFMNHRKVRFFIKIMGRKGVRIFYGILGVGMILLGILGALGLIDLS